MSQFFKIHPVSPQRRLLERTVELLQQGGLIVYPTDSSYAFGWHVGNKAALEKIRWLRKTDRDHDFTLVCRDLAQVSTYARVDNSAHRLIRSLTPGPYTFVLRATHEVPKRLQDPKKRTIGIRVPDNRITRSLLDVVGEPIMSSTLLLPGEELPLCDPDDIRERLEKQVDAIIDGGVCGVEPTTVLDLSSGSVEVLRKGKGDTSVLEA